MRVAWAVEEAATADYGDERLDARMALLLSALGSRPNLSIPAACGGKAEMAAAYRFFDNEKVTFEKVLAPHVARTLARLQGQPVVLLVQDTSEIDLTRPEQVVAGAGTLDGVRPGVLLHAMQAFTPDGTPQGTVWAQVLNRTGGSKQVRKQKRSTRAATPFEQKESLRWLTGLRQARALAGSVPSPKEVLEKVENKAPILALCTKLKAAARAAREGRRVYVTGCAANQGETSIATNPTNGASAAHATQT